MCQSRGLTTRPIQGPRYPSAMGIINTVGLRQIRGIFSPSSSDGSENSKCFTRVATMTSISKMLRNSKIGLVEFVDSWKSGFTYANRQPMHPCGPQAVQHIKSADERTSSHRVLNLAHRSSTWDITQDKRNSYPYNSGVYAHRFP